MGGSRRGVRRGKGRADGARQKKQTEQQVAQLWVLHLETSLLRCFVERTSLNAALFAVHS
jgi:hypothetical protein